MKTAIFAALFFAFVAWLRVIQPGIYPASTSLMLRYKHSGALVFAAYFAAPGLDSLKWLIMNPSKLAAIFGLKATPELGGPFWGCLEIVWLVSCVIVLVCCYLLARRRIKAIPPFQIAWALCVVGSLVRGLPTIDAGVRMSQFVGVTIITGCLYFIAAGFYGSKRIVDLLFRVPMEESKKVSPTSNSPPDGGGKKKQLELPCTRW